MIKLFDKLKKTTDESHPPLKKSDWPNHVETLDKKNFDSFVNKYPMVVVDFWSPTCKPCKAMLPRLRRLERIYIGKVAFGRVNTLKEKTLAQKYKIMGIPHFGFFHYGKKVGSVTGAKSVGDMKDSIDFYLSKYDA